MTGKILIIIVLIAGNLFAQNSQNSLMSAPSKQEWARYGAQLRKLQKSHPQYYPSDPTEAKPEEKSGGNDVGKYESSGTSANINGVSVSVKMLSKNTAPFAKQWNVAEYAKIFDYFRIYEIEYVNNSTEPIKYFPFIFSFFDGETGNSLRQVERKNAVDLGIKNDFQYYIYELGIVELTPGRSWKSYAMLPRVDKTLIKVHTDFLKSGAFKSAVLEIKS